MISVSIVTPSYNQAEFIRHTIESVQNQQYNDISHIVVDGESDDGTIGILREYDDSLDWISEADRGQTHAINKGFDRAGGDIIGWVNSDDAYVYRNTIPNVVSTFQETGADIVFGHAVTIGPDNELLRGHYIPKFNKQKLERLCYIKQPAVFFRDYVIKENKLNENRAYSMDYEFWLDLADDYDWHRINRVIAADRNHPERKIIKHEKDSHADTIAMREERGIKQGPFFVIRQYLDKLELRGRRARMLPQWIKLHRESSDAFAFDIQRRSFIYSIWTQLVRDKKRL